MGCGGSKQIEKEKTDFVKMLNTCPNLKNYTADKGRMLSFQKAWSNAVFGQSVLKPLGIYKGKRSRYNVLDQQINKAQINQLFGGGYYILEQVQQFDNDETWFYDIFILIESIKDNEHMEQVKQLSQEYENRYKKVNMAHNTQKTFIKFEDIKSSLCGWARIISYQTTTGGSKDSAHKRLEAMYEGHFE